MGQKSKRKDFLSKNGLREGVQLNKLGISRFNYGTNGIQSQMEEVDSQMSLIFESLSTYQWISLRRLSHNQRCTARRPLSPFLFIMAMEGLNVTIKTAIKKSLMQGLPLPYNGPTISHLFYADVAIFIGKRNTESIKNLASILKCFHIRFGLKVSFQKSRLFGIFVNDSNLLYQLNVLGCLKSTLPFMFLGVLVGANIFLKKNWRLVIDKVQSRLFVWREKTLSFGG